MNFSTTAEFDSELKKLSKKWRSLKTDFGPIYKTLPLLYSLQGGEKDDDLQFRRDGFLNNKRATILRTDNVAEVVKVRLDCASLGGKDILRLVFVYIKNVETITFVELYSKNDKQREDQSRIKKYI